MMSVGHGALGAPTSMTGGAALGNAEVPKQRKLDKLSAKLEMKKKEEDAKKSEDKITPAQTSEEQPLDWETLIGEKLNHFSQLLRSEIVRLKLRKFKDKII